MGRMGETGVLSRCESGCHPRRGRDVLCRHSSRRGSREVVRFLSMHPLSALKNENVRLYRPFSQRILPRSTEDGPALSLTCSTPPPAAPRGLGRLLKERGQERLGRVPVFPGRKMGDHRTPCASSVFSQASVKDHLHNDWVSCPDYNDPCAKPEASRRAVENRKGLPNHEILKELKPEKGERIVNKTTMSASIPSSLDSILRTFGIAHLVVTGVSTNSCVEGTARDAVDKGYACLLVEDACGAAGRKTS